MQILKMRCVTLTSYHSCQAFCVSGPLVWNSLPESLRTVDSVTAFRRWLKTHFLTFTYHDFTFTVLVFKRLTLL